MKTIAVEHVLVIYDEVNGDDSNPGTIDAPVRTMTTAYARLPDIFMKKAGILNGTGLSHAEREQRWRKYVGEDISYALPAYKTVSCQHSDYSIQVPCPCPKSCACRKACDSMDGNKNPPPSPSLRRR